MSGSGVNGEPRIVHDDGSVVLWLGDCLDVLRGMADASVDAVVTDPPYGLGTREPTVDNLIAYLRGGDLDHGGDFMGKDWTMPSVAIWREVYRVLKPGAHVLCFAGTRTWDVMSLGLRAAGFENRDTIGRGVPALAWLAGSGFPKALDVSRAIDASMGAERARLGARVYAGGHVQRSGDDALAPPIGTFVRTQDRRDETAPSSEEARRWDGWATALKPAWEVVLMFRKPLQGTVVGNVLAHGTGALNIDGCRVTGSQGDGHWSGDDGSDATSRPGFDGGFTKGGAQSTPWREVEPGTFRNARCSFFPSACPGHGDADQAQSGATVHADRANAGPPGRWPPNVLLSHVAPDAATGADGCERVGTKRVRSGVSGVGGGFRTELVGGELKETELAGRAWGTYNDVDGLETVAAYQCVNGCPVAILDQQSGAAGASAPVLGTEPTAGQLGGHGIYGTADGDGRPGPFYGDEGGASRFFPQFQADPLDDVVPFFYCAKAARSEREQGCEHLPARRGAEAVDREEGSAGVQSPRAGAGRTASNVRNHHPTVKPVDLMRWLVRLVTPPAGTILDPFMGSGSTGIAAIREGFKFIGVEREPDYIAIAQARIVGEAPLFRRPAVAPAVRPAPATTRRASRPVRAAAELRRPRRRARHFD